MAVQPIPGGYKSITPYLIVSDAGRLLDFVRDAFGGRERFRMADDAGKIAHAEVEVGDSLLMICDANEKWPPAGGALHLYVEDCDATYRRALAAGAESVQEVTDQFYGDRSGGVRDASGCLWWIATHVEDVAPDEMERRREAMQAKAMG